MGFLSTVALLLMANDDHNSGIGIDIFTRKMVINTGGDFGFTLDGDLEYNIAPGIDVQLF